MNRHDRGDSSSARRRSRLWAYRSFGISAPKLLWAFGISAPNLRESDKTGRSQPDRRRRGGLARRRGLTATGGLHSPDCAAPTAPSPAPSPRGRRGSGDRRPRGLRRQRARGRRRRAALRGRSRYFRGGRAASPRSRRLRGGSLCASGAGAPRRRLCRQLVGRRVQRAGPPGPLASPAPARRSSRRPARPARGAGASARRAAAPVRPRLHHQRRLPSPSRRVRGGRGAGIRAAGQGGRSNDQTPPPE